MDFVRQNGELILEYDPDNVDPDIIFQRLAEGESWNIRHCFFVTESHLRQTEDEPDSLRFCIGTVEHEYTKLDSSVIGTDHTFFFANNIPLKEKMFIASYHISILRKIDAIIESDIYIGGTGQSIRNFLPIEVYNSLVLKFPKTSELQKYTSARIANIIKEYFSATEIHERVLDNYLERQSALGPNDLSYKNKLLELEQFESLSHYLENLLNEAEGINESSWQNQVHNIIRFLYPKYILGAREITIRGADGYDKRPDFLLVDANGYVDIMEIKKPSVQLLTKQSSYRNNYVPVRELSGVIQQIEKYIFCLNAWGKEGDEYLERRLGGQLPMNVVPKIVNPQGILILGRSIDFNTQQKNDFELIKRQYKHIADIMTYDDLSWRINNIISALRMSL